MTPKIYTKRCSLAQSSEAAMRHDEKHHAMHNSKATPTPSRQNSLVAAQTYTWPTTSRALRAGRTKARRSSTALAGDVHPNRSWSTQSQIAPGKLARYDRKMEEMALQAFDNTTHALKIRPRWLQEILTGPRSVMCLTSLAAKQHALVQATKRWSSERSHARHTW